MLSLRQNRLFEGGLVRTSLSRLILNYSRQDNCRQNALALEGITGRRLTHSSRVYRGSDQEVSRSAAAISSRSSARRG
jgi:hypothetical protein